MIVEVIASMNRKIEILKGVIMSPVVRTVLGAALLLTSASTAMAQSANPPVANQPVQAGAATATPQTGTATAAVAANAATAGQASRNSDVADNRDSYGGHDPNSTAGTRAFWESRNQY